MGHPSNSAMARAMRVTGASDDAIKIALDWNCEVCKSQQKPGSHVPAKLGRDREINDCIAVDLFSLRDITGEMKSFLNIIDLASTYWHLAGVVSLVAKSCPSQ